MKQKLQRILRLRPKPTVPRTSKFNGPLLDQKREDVFLVMHRNGLIR